MEWGKKEKDLKNIVLSLKGLPRTQLLMKTP
jgi:hypothetical protein